MNTGEMRCELWSIKIVLPTARTYSVFDRWCLGLVQAFLHAQASRPVQHQKRLGAGKTLSPSFAMKPSRSTLLASLAVLTGIATPLPRGLDRHAVKDDVRVFTVKVLSDPSQPDPAAPYNWREGSVDEYPIHASCNGTERAQLRRALDETMDLARHARDHIRRFGRSSSIYARYFGNASTGEPIGWLDKLASGDKGGMWFRCDDVDGNCHQAGKLGDFLRPQVWGVTDLMSENADADQPAVIFQAGAGTGAAQTPARKRSFARCRTRRAGPSRRCAASATPSRRESSTCTGPRT